MGISGAPRGSWRQTAPNFRALGMRQENTKKSEYAHPNDGDVPDLVLDPLMVNGAHQQSFDAVPALFAEHQDQGRGERHKGGANVRHGQIVGKALNSKSRIQHPERDRQDIDQQEEFPWRPPRLIQNTVHPSEYKGMKLTDLRYRTL